MTRTVSRYGLHTVDLVCVRTDLPADLAGAAGLDWVLGDRRIMVPGGLPEAWLSVRPAGAGGLCLPPDLADKPIARPGRLQIGRNGDGDRVLVLDGAVSVTLLARGHSRVVVDPSVSSSAFALGEAMIHALDHAISSNGQCLAHAACLSTPDGQGMVMLHAASGTGKTTTAMALALAGFGLSGDDTTALVANPAGGPVSGWGLPRGAKLHRRTVAMLPALGSLVDGGAWNGQGEQMIGRDALHGAGLATRAGPLPVVAVVALTGPDDPGGPVERRGAFDAVEALMHDNVSANPGGFFPGHEARFGLFTRLVTTARCFRVPVRGSPRDIAAAIAGAIGP